jgi:hypothetical protein
MPVGVEDSIRPPCFPGFWTDGGPRGANLNPGKESIQVGCEKRKFTSWLRKVPWQLIKGQVPLG